MAVEEVAAKEPTCTGNGATEVELHSLPLLVHLPKPLITAMSSFHLVSKHPTSLFPVSFHFNRSRAQFFACLEQEDQNQVL